MSQALLGIVSPTAAQKYGDQLGKNPVGTGPYTFVKWDENADIVVAKNKDYNWGPETVENKGAPHVDTITFKIVPEEATRIGSVQSSQVLAAETVPPQNIAALKTIRTSNCCRPTQLDCHTHSFSICAKRLGMM